MELGLRDSSQSMMNYVQLHLAFNVFLVQTDSTRDGKREATASGSFHALCLSRLD